MKSASIFKAALWMAAALWAGAALAAGPNYPFGSRLDAYPHGTKVNHKTPAEMDAAIKGFYDSWKAKPALVASPGVSGGLAVTFDRPGVLTVSEGMGYGMLISVLMAGYDPQAQNNFDSLFRTARAHPAYSTPAPGSSYLMDWKVNSDGTSGGDGWNATDGDMDIAMALLMADRQWGSGGAVNYKQEAINTIIALKAWNMSPDGSTGGCPTAGVSRTSDYMIGHFRAFGQATGDSFWSSTAFNRAYALINTMQTVWSPGVGVMPDFIVGADTNQPSPSPGGKCDFTPTEGFYFSNAQRDPWRWGTDYVFSGDQDWKAVLTKMMNFFMADSGGTPGAPIRAWSTSPPTFGNMAIGYHLDGSHMTPADINCAPDPAVGRYCQWPALGVVAGAMNGAQSDPAYQGYLNASWDWLGANWVTSYYDAETTFLSMIVASGNWWNPAASGSPPPPPPPAGLMVEAENASRSASLSVDTNVAGFSGAGYVTPFSNAGDTVMATFSVATAGSYDVHLRYHAWGRQLNYVSIDGGALQERQFPQTFQSPAGDWQDVVLPGVPFSAGTHTVAVIAEWGYIDLDYIKLVAAGGASPQQHVAAHSGTFTPSPTLQVRTDPNLPGYDDGDFVGDFSSSARTDRLNLNFTNVTAGTYTIKIKYHVWGPQQNFVIVNNGTAQDVSFPAVGTNGTGWGVVSLPNQSLAAGTNTISILEGWGYIDVNWIEIVSTQ